MRVADPSSVESFVKTLADDSRARPAVGFPSGHGRVDVAGMYSWWADPQSLEMMREELSEEIPALIYVGQSGATRWPSGAPSSATLTSRIRTNHLNGNASSSTFRLTVSALLVGPLGLSIAKAGRLIPADRVFVSAWIKEHLSVLTVPFSDRDALGSLENRVLETLDPPFNLKGMRPTSVRNRLAKLRRVISSP